MIRASYPVRRLARVNQRIEDLVTGVLMVRIRLVVARDDDLFTSSLLKSTLGLQRAVRQLEVAGTGGLTAYPGSLRRHQTLSPQDAGPSLLAGLASTICPSTCSCSLMVTQLRCRRC